MGEKIKSARMDKKLTLEKLSEKIGISRNFLWEIEAGRKAPAIQTLYKISESLNISIDYLFGLNEQQVLNQQNSDKHNNIYSLILSLDENEADFIYRLLKAYKNI